MIKKIRRPKNRGYGNHGYGNKQEQKSTVIMQTNKEHHVELHPKSVNNHANGQFKYPWMTYHLKMRSSKA